MKQSDFSPQFATLWGAQADTSHMQSPIPSTSSDNGRASLALGFPPANFTAPEAGGTFMYGQDLNGSLKMLSTSAQNYESGVIPPFSASFAARSADTPQGRLSLTQVRLAFTGVRRKTTTQRRRGQAEPRGQTSLAGIWPRPVQRNPVRRIRLSRTVFLPITFLLQMGLLTSRSVRASAWRVKYSTAMQSRLMELQISK